MGLPENHGLRTVLFFLIGITVNALAVKCRMPQCEVTNLAECVLGWWGVAPISTPLRNAIKGVACVQTAVLFRNAIKRSCVKKCVHLTQVYRSQHCSGASGLIVATSKLQKIVIRGRKKELGDWDENGNKGREPNATTTL